MSDLISRQAAIDVLEERLQANGYSNVALVSEFNRSIGYLMRLPSAQQDCTDCPEYDTERHFCPRYCKTIRKTLEEAKQERTGRWIQHEDSEDTSLAFLTPYHCSECGAVCRDIRDKWCYGCGARMEEPEDIPMEYFESGGR